MNAFWYIVFAAIVAWLLSRYVKISVKPIDSASTQAVIGATRGLHSKVVGVTFNNTDGTPRQKLIKTHCRVGMPLELKPEPDNQHDPNAVGIWATAGQIGYVERGRLSADIGKKIHAGKRVSARISDITGGTKGLPTLGVNISIEIEA